ncbi:MAG: hypothetical protein Q9223_007889 [Gallowayella weberi]
MVTTVKKVFAFIATAFKCSLIYAVLITIVVILQNSAHYLTPLLISILEDRAVKADTSAGSALPLSRCLKTLEELQKEAVFATNMTTLLVAVQLSVLITLGLCIAARFGIGLTVEMNTIEMGWHTKAGGECQLLKQEDE